MVVYEEGGDAAGHHAVPAACNLLNLPYAELAEKVWLSGVLFRTVPADKAGQC